MSSWDPGEVDLVIPTIRNLNFLEKWRGVIDGCHIIVVQDGDPSRRIRVPEGLDCEIFNHRDVERILGDRSYCISYKDSACRCFGWLVSRKRYIYTLDDDCFLPEGIGRDVISPLDQHMTNLLTPATPYYFNTLYDPYSAGADFVRGYPFSLRDAVPTAVSHGLWLNVPRLRRPHATNEAPRAKQEIRRRSHDHSQGDPIPNVRDESGV